MAQGTIRKLINKTADENGGKPSAFGFIRDGAGEDFFFLPSTLYEDAPVGLWEQFKVGDAVTFTPTDHHKGRRAVDVKPA